MEKKWRNFPKGRRWLYFLIFVTVFNIVVEAFKAVDFSRAPAPAWMQAPTWYERLGDILLYAVILTACFAYDRRRLLRDRGIGLPPSKRWRQKIELRWVLFTFAARSIVELPIGIYKTIQVMHDPSTSIYGPAFWRNFESEYLVVAVIGASLIVYDRWRLRRDALIETGYCHVCGYDLRATPERCPECGTLTAPALPR